MVRGRAFVNPTLNTWIKICGVTRVEDALLLVECGVDAVGLNFVPSSKRRVRPEQGVELVSALRRASKKPPTVIGVFANQPQDEVLEVAHAVGLDGIQLHGDELPRELRSYQDNGWFAFKAVRIADEGDVLRAAQFAGETLLADAKVGTELGGTGHVFDWRLVEELNQDRRLILAGGLTEHNVADAVRQLRPYGVDTASGVESAPGIKSEERVRAFVARCRAVDATRASG